MRGEGERGEEKMDHESFFGYRTMSLLDIQSK